MFNLWDPRNHLERWPVRVRFVLTAFRGRSEGNWRTCGSTKSRGHSGNLTPSRDTPTLPHRIKLMISVFQDILDNFQQNCILSQFFSFGTKRIQWQYNRTGVAQTVRVSVCHILYCALWHGFESHQCWKMYVDEKKLNCNADQEVNRCRTKGGSEEFYCGLVTKHTSKWSTLALKPRADVTSKQG